MDIAALNTLIDQALAAPRGAQILAVALAEVAKVGRAGIVRARLIEAIEARRPEAAAVVHAAHDAAPEGEPFDYIGTLIAALPVADRPTASLTASVAPAELSDDDRAMLALEREAAGRMPAGTKAERVRALGYTHIGYYQRLNTLIDTRAALAAEPVLVQRLRRFRGASSVRRGVRAA